eukprot:4680032-Pleurochrysis_carterae.AAC.1
MGPSTSTCSRSPGPPVASVGSRMPCETRTRLLLLLRLQLPPPASFGVVAANLCRPAPRLAELTPPVPSRA